MKRIFDSLFRGGSEKGRIQEQRSRHEKVRDNFYKVGGYRLIAGIEAHVRRFSGNPRMEMSVSYYTYDPETTKLGINNEVKTVDRHSLAAIINKTAKNSHELLSSIEIEIHVGKDEGDPVDMIQSSTYVKISHAGVTVDNKPVRDEDQAMLTILKSV